MKKISTPPTQFPYYLTGISISPASQLRSKKFLFSIFVLFLMGFHSIAQVDTNSQWTWMSGDNTANQPGIYGTQGIASTGNFPGARKGAVTWTDANNILWLFGGMIYTTPVFSSIPGGYLNDLWRYNPTTNEWTWVSGNKEINQLGNYGTKSISAQSNQPGARSGSVSWTGSDGKLWLMGGYGFGSTRQTSGASLNDLWCYDPVINEWTWVKGDNIPNVAGVYGTKGVPSMESKPGSRNKAVSWKDKDGNFWMMGGYGLDKFESRGDLNDLWKYNPSTNEWTWINGDYFSYGQANYGIQGIPSANNKPGGGEGAVSWTGLDGNFWLMHGIYSNELWRYSPSTNEWTWMKGDSICCQHGKYGIKGIASNENTPGGRTLAITWTDKEGKFWLLGGSDGEDPSGFNPLNDLWKYDPLTNQWTWMKGDSVGFQPGIRGISGIEDSSNIPSGRYDAVSWTGTDGKLWLFGGSANIKNGPAGFFNDLFKYNIESNNWTWMKGGIIPNEYGVYGIQGSPAKGNKPGARSDAVSWTTSDGTMWLMGGSIYTEIGDPVLLNDLWKYNPATNKWIWVSGDSISNQFSVYGTKGISSSTNKPGARYRAVGWTDLDGKFWLMGGDGYSASGFGSLNDLWKYDPVTNQWTWIKGDDAINQMGVYGNQGESAAGNNPGGRIHAINWTDNKGKLWLMGGVGYTSVGRGYLNDLWKFDPFTNEWTWVKGNNVPYVMGVYGTMGIADADNGPGSRQYASSWTDQNGKLWLMGGAGNGVSGFGSLNDLWKYDPETNKWTWMKGDIAVNQISNYGTQGIPSSNNNPGGRYGSSNWIDKDGKLWLMGGIVNVTTTTTGWYNDLWKYDPLKNEWTWVKGDTIPNTAGIYGTPGIASLSNKPGARDGSVNWLLPDGNFWLMGGTGFPATGGGVLNDLWKITPSINTYYQDADGDGYGNPNISKQANYVPAGYVLKSVDCNDNNIAINPGATEICDGVDNNCNGQIDEGCSPVISINDIIVREGDNGYRNAVFTVWLNSKPTSPVSLHYQTIEGTAIDPEDYMSKSGTITFAPNCLVQTVTVKVRGDRIKEHKERFSLLLFDPVNGILRNNSATCTIIDDDKGPAIRIHDAQATENNQLAKVKVTLSDESRQIVKVQYDTKDKSARAPSDYTGICNNQLIFMPGETEKFIHVVIKKDNINEKTEEFLVILKDAVNATLDQGHENRSVAEVQIINSEPSGYDCYGTAGNFSEQTDQPLSLQLKALPNPSANYFQLNINSNGKGVIRLRVTDMLGRVVEDRKTAGMVQQIKLGENWRYGNYILELTQGDERKTIQLIKLR